MITKTIKKFYPDGRSEMVEATFPEQVSEPSPAPTQTVENDLLSMTVDHEYRLTILELGVI